MSIFAVFQWRRIRAFTLVELILVLAIISVVVAVTTPSLVASIRGNRLRTASRTVVTAGRYARSMAVLKQAEMSLSLDMEKGTVAVKQSEKRINPDRPAPDGEDAGAARAAGSGGTNAAVTSDSLAGDQPAAGIGGTAGGDMIRQLDRVKIVSIETKKGGKLDNGRCSIAYRTNGTCDPYTIVMRDEYGVFVTINVDALSSAETEAGTP